jgi:hypothetical protein
LTTSKKVDDASKNLDDTSREKSAGRKISAPCRKISAAISLGKDEDLFMAGNKLDNTSIDERTSLKGDEVLAHLNFS